MKRLLFSLLVSIGLIFSLGVAPAAAFNPFEGVCGSGGDSFVCNTSKKDPITGKDQEGVIIKAVKLLSLVIGVAAVIVIVLAGLQYIISAGDPNQVSQAKNTILYAVVGLAIAVAARTILAFVISKL